MAFSKLEERGHLLHKTGTPPKHFSRECISLKSEINNPWFSIFCTHNQFCVPQYKGAFNNYGYRILPIFDTPSPLHGHFLYPERGQKQIFFDPSFCQHNYWMPPKGTDVGVFPWDVITLLLGRCSQCNQWLESFPSNKYRNFSITLHLCLVLDQRYYECLFFIFCPMRVHKSLKAAYL